MTVLLVRADAGPDVGTGHAMRCIAIAEAWREAGGSVAFGMAHCPAGVHERLRTSGFEVREVGTASETAELALSLGASCAVLDGYHFSLEYQDALAQSGAVTLVIDDNAEVGRYAAPLVLNVNPFATPEMYAERGARTRLLLGLRYALLRSEFRAPRAPSLTPEFARRLLVTFGGADPANFTARVLDACRSLADMEVTAVVGAANPHLDEIRAMSGPRVRVVPPQRDMAAVMAEADIAVVSASGSCWELAHLGVPVLAVVTADNQERVAASIESLGLGRSLGHERDLTLDGMREAIMSLALDQRERLAARVRGPELVDGLGARRVYDALVEVRS